MTGPELRALREAKGYSLTALAEATGVNVSTICRYQSGALAIPRTFELAIRQLRKRPAP